LPGDLSGLRCGPLLPGETLVLHTDGAEDARDARGRFFSLTKALQEAVDTPPQTVLGTVFTALLNHTGGRPKDDVALLALRNDRQPIQSAGAPGTARQAATRPQPTTHL
jgi:hypothetical protein